ncbi:uncharacterized protein LOC135290782 isoform X2 [Passer domesticus]|uniref:uncharacterized protein LOC135290782 isoform X2 n=1 Tax=Passer domesticus TaxID=48849 RepID=UPI0030FE192E
MEFLVWTTEEHTTLPLNWKTDTPVWVDQWPFPEEKLATLNDLVEEQVRLGHLLPSKSPWNTLVFVIKKPGKDKCCLLPELHRVNDVIEDMGPLQPGLPSPFRLPRDWELTVLNIKDCFCHFSTFALLWRMYLASVHTITLPQDLSSSSGFTQVLGKPDGELLNMGGGQLTAKRTKIVSREAGTWESWYTYSENCLAGCVYLKYNFSSCLLYSGYHICTKAPFALLFTYVNAQTVSK